MADLLIKNMEMPKEGSLVLYVQQDGTVIIPYDYTVRFQTPVMKTTAVELPEHGELMDKKAFFESEKGRTVVIGRAGARAIRELYERIEKAPAVVEAAP